MSDDLATQMVSLSAEQTRTSANIAVIRKRHEMDMALINMIDEVTSKAPAPTGQGSRVDKTA